jgi:hypothetical protein
MPRKTSMLRAIAGALLLGVFIAAIGYLVDAPPPRSIEHTIILQEASPL